MSASYVDCCDLLAARVVQVANLAIRELGQMTSVLGGLRPDGRLFMVFLGGLYVDDHVRRREFVAHVLAAEGVVAYAHASYFSVVSGEGTIRMHVVAESKTKSTLIEFELDSTETEARAWKQVQVVDLVVADHWHPYARLPEQCEIKDATRASEYDARWQSLRSDEARCLWGWEVGCQVPGFPFPTAIAGRRLERLFEYEDVQPGLGYSARYAGAANDRLDLYAYKRGLPDGALSDEARWEALEREFGAACAAVDELRRTSPATAVDLIEYGTLSYDSRNSPSMALARFKLSDQGGEIDSFLALTVFRGLFIKLRLSMPSSIDAFDRAKEVCGSLASYLSHLESFS